MLVIHIANDFSRTPGARNYADGPFSGEEFYDQKLRAGYTQAVSQGVKLKIILDGTEGYASSFLNEAFSLLGSEFGAETVLPNLVVVSNEVPKYITRVEAAVREKRTVGRKQLAH